MAIVVFSPGVKCQSFTTVELPGSYGSESGAICGCAANGSALADGARALETAISRQLAVPIYTSVSFINTSKQSFKLAALLLCGQFTLCMCAFCEGLEFSQKFAR